MHTLERLGRYIGTLSTLGSGHTGTCVVHTMSRYNALQLEDIKATCSNVKTNTRTNRDFLIIHIGNPPSPQNFICRFWEFIWMGRTDGWVGHMGRYSRWKVSRIVLVWLGLEGSKSDSVPETKLCIELLHRAAKICAYMKLCLIKSFTRFQPTI